MNMKTNNKIAGLKQAATGYIPIPRKHILECLTEYKLSVADIGYYVCFVLVADWDASPMRKGFIRHDNKQLAKILNVSLATVSRIITKLKSSGLITVENNILKICFFDAFTHKGARSLSKEKICLSDLEKLFPNFVEEFSFMKQFTQEDSNSFNDSYKGGMGVNHDSEILTDLDYDLIDKAIENNKRRM